ncbi:pilin [Thioflexithrix psekupsensis]|uniref:Prepilin-type N-terminal cleavage/methylation domain-containing protein n=1 Tax=Thioflexithrix psekupsensis TaxID=1570016 RepID=A0A251X8A9_9GAMM|nr:pilin [Thioflexithrix psekupsensis]OUD14236.1 hypothetical protein TPSD3_07865 [Thioflexithrix psekupsensis]
MRKIKSGFVFLELLLVVFVISILAVVSIPAYSDYLERAKVTEALAISQPVQQHIAEYYAWHGRWPENNAVLGLPEPTQWQGRYLRQLTVNQGKIELQVALTSTELVLFFTPIIDSSNTRIVHWNCHPTEGLHEEVNPFLPSSCRNR